MRSPRIIAVVVCVVVGLSVAAVLGSWALGRRLRRVAETTPPPPARVLNEDGESQAPAAVPAIAIEALEARLAAETQKTLDWQSLRPLLSESARREPAKTAAWVVRRFGPGGNRSFALHHVMRRWVERDPAAAMAWAGGLTRDQGRECALRALFRAWAALDPGASAAALATVTDFSMKAIAAGSIAYYWAERDLQAATTWAWGLPDGPVRNCALASLLRVLIRKDTQNAKSLAAELRKHAADDDVLRAIGRLVSPDDPEAGAGWAAGKIPGGWGGDPAFQINVALWAIKETEDATAWAAELDNDRWEEFVSYTMIQVLTSRNPAAARDILALMPAGERRDRALRKVAASLAGEDPVAAREWAESLEDPAEQDMALAVLDEPPPVPSEEDPPSEPVIPADAFFWPWWDLVPLVEQLPDSALRSGLAHKTAVDMSKEDPVASILWISEQVPEGRDRDTTLRVIVWDWSTRDAAAAIEWIQQDGDAVRREQEQATLVLVLGRTDPAAASQVLAGMPAGDRRTTSLSSLAYQWALVDTPAATAWAGTLADELERQAALASIAKVAR